MPLSWLFVPGDRPERFAKATASGADVVIIDLEDSVVDDHKASARANARAFLADDPGIEVEVRVNAVGTPWGADDVAALRGVGGLRAIRVPKVESPSALPVIEVPLVATIESARGVEVAYDIARAPGVAAICLGEADLRSDLGVNTDEGLLWARSRIVVAARAAGLPAPAMSAYPYVSDLSGLAASCALGRRLGFVGRTAIHPRQIPVIELAFLPSESEVAAARGLLEAYAAGLADGRGVIVLADGRMVDAAMVGAARSIVDQSAQGR